MGPLAIAFLLFAGSLALSIAATRTVWTLAARWHVGMQREANGVEADSTPGMGGVAVFVAWAIPLALLGLFGGQRWSHLFGDRHVVVGVSLSASVMFLLGLYDDIRGASAWLKLAVQVSVALALYMLGIRIETVSNPFGEPFVLGLFAPVLTVFWIVGVTHAVNLMDGIDGLAAGVCAMTALVMGLASQFVGSSTGILYAVPTAGAAAGFLVYNFPPARVLMGASGTFFLGSILATISLLSSQKGHVAVTVFVPVIAFGLPLTNASLAVLRRFLAGRGIFQADGRHVYHRLLALGLSPRLVVLILYGVTLAFGTAALLLVNASGVRAALIVCTVLGIIVIACSRLGYHEFRHIWDFLQRGMGHRGELIFTRQLVNLAGQHMAEANSFGEIWDEIKMVARLLLFDRVTFEPSGSKNKDQACAAEMGLGSVSSKHVWAKSHAVESAALGNCVEIPVKANGRACGTIAFERLSSRISAGDRAVLAELGEHVSARMAVLDGDVAKSEERLTDTGPPSGESGTG